MLPIPQITLTTTADKALFNTSKASFAIRTWLLYESECVVLCLHYDPVANGVVFLEECLYIELEDRI